MKILKTGKIYAFKCVKCETIFVAGAGELQSESGSTVLECICPLCGNLIRETHSDSNALLCKMNDGAIADEE